MNSSLLHVVTCVFNPMRWKSRIKLYNEFEQHMLDSGVKLTTVEVALGERPYELHNPHVNHVKTRAHTILWNKECALNLGTASITRNFPDWKYVAMVDADVTFRNKAWASETVHALQQYQIIQPWSKCLDLGPGGELLYVWNSFCKQVHQSKPMSVTANPNYTYAHSGYAWAYRRQALEWLGGLIETAALGAADHHMAWGLVGHADWTIPKAASPGYHAPILQWQKRATIHINQNIGYLHHSDIEHTWHGDKDRRGYKTRWSIITENNFDPATDTMKNIWGMLELAGNKPKLRLELDKYFRSRAEDSNFYGGSLI